MKDIKKNIGDYIISKLREINLAVEKLVVSKKMKNKKFTSEKKNLILILIVILKLIFSIQLI